MLLLYVVVACVGVFFMLNADLLASQSDEVDARAIWLQATLMTGISIPLMFIFALGLLTPRRRWGWVYGFVPIAIGLTSPCCMPASIPLLIFWLKPEVKQWFNMS